MPITPTVAQLSGGNVGLGDQLSQQADEEEQKRRRKLGLSAQALQSPTVSGLLGGISGMGGYSLGGMR